MGAYSYHSGVGRGDLSNRSTFKVGFEIEKEDMAMRRRINDTPTKALHDPLNGWVIENDSSLGRYGFELVSPVLNLYNDEQILGHLNLLNIYILAGQGSSCGGHIHISSTKATPTDLLHKFFFGYLPLLYVLYPKRTTNRYCEAKRHAYYLEFHRLGASPARYSALYPRRDTLEIRLFPSPRSMKSLFWRVKLIRWILEHPTKNPEDVIDMLVEPDSKLYGLLGEVYRPEILEERIKTIRRVATKFTGVTINEDKIAKIIKKKK